VVLGYILLVVMPIVVVAYIVWDHRRKMAEREAASAGRLQELLGVAALPQLAEREGLRAPVSAAPAAPATAVPSAASLPQSAAVPAAPLYAARERVLSSPQTLLYYLLRTGLPDHVILARVTLASLLEAGPGLEGVAREEQIRRLSALTVDFVVADKGMRPVTVIDLAAHGIGGAAQADRAATRSRLAAAGVRYLELEPTALPRKDAIRAVVLDEIDSTNAPRAATAASPVEPV
jgi:hypothetical protein